MVDKTAAGSQQTDQRDADTRDSLAALARRRSNSSPIVLQSDVQAAPQEKQEKQKSRAKLGLPCKRARMRMMTRIVRKNRKP